MIYPSVPLIKEETYAKTGEPSAKRPLLRQGADTPLGTVPRGLGLGRSKSTDAVNCSETACKLINTRRRRLWLEGP